MPCSCGNRVDRSQQKIQCAKCNELFHLKCVGIRAADVEFLLNSDQCFYCKVCATARRNSIRSPPPTLVLNDDTITKLNITNNSNNINSNDQKCCDIDSTLKTLLSEVTALKANNVQLVSMLKSALDEKNNLLIKVNDLQVELRSMHKTVRDNNIDIANNIKDLKANFAALNVNLPFFSCHSRSPADLCIGTDTASHANACGFVAADTNIDPVVALNSDTSSSALNACFLQATNAKEIPFAVPASVAADMTTSAAPVDAAYNVTRSNPPSSLSASSSTPAAFTTRTITTVT